MEDGSREKPYGIERADDRCTHITTLAIRRGNANTSQHHALAVKMVDREYGSNSGPADGLSELMRRPL